MTTSVQQDQESISEKVRGMLQHIKNEAEHSKEMHSVGVNTSLAAAIESLLADPITSVFDMYNFSRVKAQQIVKLIATTFIQSQSDLILKAFDVTDKDRSIFYIVLKNDNTENRSIFFEFLSIFDEIGVTEGLPVIIKFLPERVMGEVNFKNELVFN